MCDIGDFSVCLELTNKEFEMLKNLSGEARDPGGLVKLVGEILARRVDCIQDEKPTKDTGAYVEKCRAECDEG